MRAPSLRSPRYAVSVSATMLLASLLLVGTPSAQELVDAGFCKGIKGEQCVGVIANGASVRMDELVTTRDAAQGKDYRTIYLWASTYNRSQRLVAFAEVRTGDCYRVASEPTLRGAAGRDIEDDWLTSVRSWMANHSLAEIWQFLGIASVGKGDISLKLTTTEASQRYRTHEFRYVHCPGQLSFRVIDSGGNIIPPPDRNIVRTVTITP